MTQIILSAAFRLRPVAASDEARALRKINFLPLALPVVAACEILTFSAGGVSESGILSCVFFVLVSFQSCAVGVGEVLTESEETGGAGGILLAVLMIAGGIVSIATRKGGKAGNIALIILFALAALIGFSNAGSYTDLNIWAGWCLINAVIAVIALITSGKKKTGQTES